MSEKFPSSLIIVGAGIFGLSTALAVARRFPATQVTLIDRLTPPVEDGTSVDTTRCIRADYHDPIYARLAGEAQQKIENDPDLKQFYFKQGMSFICDGKPSRFTEIWKAQEKLAKARHGEELIIDMTTPEEVFQRIHGNGSEPPSPQALGREQSWNLGYCNLDDAFIDAKESVRIYYERCLAEPSITGLFGTAVDRIETTNGTATGVVLENGQVIKAEKTLVAAGAWSNKLVYIEGRSYSTAHEVAWIKVTDEEAVKWKNMSITTNLSTGLNLFPPYNGEVKILRRSRGYCNTVSVPHPEDPSKFIEISHPRTIVTNPTDMIPAEAEAELRDNLREIMPALADRPFDRTKLCWLSHSPSSDFLIASHPRIAGLHVSSAGSAHAWKFLPIIGDLVLDSMEGVLTPELAEKWAWIHEGDGGNHLKMEGPPEELREVVRSRGTNGA